jgi:hypothetical protein
VLGTTFTLLSSGMSLIVTFVPGVIVTWLTYVWLFVRQTRLPNGSGFLPWFFSLLAVHVAAALLQRGHTMLLVDADPQGSALD